MPCFTAPVALVADGGGACGLVGTGDCGLLGLGLCHLRHLGKPGGGEGGLGGLLAPTAALFCCGGVGLPFCACRARQHALLRGVVLPPLLGYAPSDTWESQAGGAASVPWGDGGARALALRGSAFGSLADLRVLLMARMRCGCLRPLLFLLVRLRVPFGAQAVPSGGLL